MILRRMELSERFELEPPCGRERGEAEQESAGEILTLSLPKGKDLLDDDSEEDGALREIRT